MLAARQENESKLNEIMEKLEEFEKMETTGISSNLADQEFKLYGVNS